MLTSGIMVVVSGFWVRVRPACIRWSSEQVSSTSKDHRQVSVKIVMDERQRDRKEGKENTSIISRGTVVSEQLEGSLKPAAGVCCKQFPNDVSSFVKCLCGIYLCFLFFTRQLCFLTGKIFFLIYSYFCLVFH